MMALGLDPRREIRRLARGSCYVRTFLLSGDVVAMWGVCGTLLSSDSYVWVGITPSARWMPLTFIRECRRGLVAALATRDSVYSYTHPIDRRSARWLAFLGFEFGEPDERGFCTATLRRV